MIKTAKILSYTSEYVVLQPPGGGPVFVPRGVVRGPVQVGRMVALSGKITEGGVVQP